VGGCSAGLAGGARASVVSMVLVGVSRSAPSHSLGRDAGIKAGTRNTPRGTAERPSERGAIRADFNGSRP
jgi:hypothetical protein